MDLLRESLQQTSLGMEMMLRDPDGGPLMIGLLVVTLIASIVCGIGAMHSRR